MSLKFLYITNRTDVAEIAQKNGVDRIFVDMEHIGKSFRQNGLNTVKSHHTVDDVIRLRKVVNQSELLVRVNPIHDKTDEYMGSEAEINAVIDAGADVVMLPMAKTPYEIERFVKCVDGRARTLFLLETAEANENVDAMLSVGGIDEVHIGLNDLHIAYNKRFMFEILTDGTVDKLCEKIKSFNLPYGIGGIAKLGGGLLPAEYIITEHYRLGSSAAILSRSFCDINDQMSIDQIEYSFTKELDKIRKFENAAARFTEEEYQANRNITAHLVNIISESIGRK